MPSADWLADMQSEIEGSTVPRRRSFSNFQANDDTKWGLPLFLLAVLMTVGLVGAYLYRTRTASVAQLPAQQGYYDPSFWNNQTTMVPPPRYQDTITRQDLEAHQAAMTKIWDRTKWNTDIITLMSIVDNHNLQVDQKGYSKNYYLYINEDWTIDRIPECVQLSAQDRAWIQKFVRKR